MAITYTKKMRNQAKQQQQQRDNRPSDTQVKQIVKSMINNDVEMKYFDQFGAGQIPVAGNLVCISDITRGTDPIQRIGNQVTFKHLMVRFTTNIHPNAVNDYNRLMVVMDKQGYNAPSITDILEPAYLSSPYTAVAPVHWDYRKRFKILYDQKVLLTQAAFTAGALTVDIPLNIKSQNIGTSTTFINQLYLLILTTETNVLSLPGMYWQSRLTFTDE